MTELFISLTVIAVISAVVPVIAHLIPHKVIPEAVLLIVVSLAVRSDTRRGITWHNRLSVAFYHIVREYPYLYAVGSGMNRTPLNRSTLNIRSL